LSGNDRRDLLKDIEPVFSVSKLLELQQQVKNIHVSDPILDYIQNILHLSRSNSLFVTGLSPRAGLALVIAAKSWAFIHQRQMVIPDDINAILPSIILHRLHTDEQNNISKQQILTEFESINAN